MDMKDKGNGRKGGSNGALGGASSAELEAGYINMDDENMERDSDFDDMAEPMVRGGFAGRPHGFER